MDYTVKYHGDWLEQHAADFITTFIPAYQLIWQKFIGHQGNGKMAKMININSEDEIIRTDFSQYHYTALESLYFMQLIVNDETKTNPIKTFEDYRKINNQMMAFQAYSGRLRDNLEKCIELMIPKQERAEIMSKMQDFYHQRCVYLHGRKIPISIDSDYILKIAKVQKNPTSRSGFGLEMPWNTVQKEDMDFFEVEILSLINDFKQLVQNILSALLVYIKQFLSERNLVINPPSLDNYTPYISGTTNSHVSGSICSSYSPAGI